MTTNPEQEARAAYAEASWAHHLAEARGRLGAKNDAECTELAKVAEAKGDMYGRERYLAGKVEGLAVVMRQQQQAFKHVEGCTCHGCNSLRYNIDKAEAEYAACVAALQEAKHG